MEKQFLQTMNYRHATKEFDTAKKISKEDFDFILKVGNLSPSSFGFEPWKFLVIQNMNKREKITEFAWGAKRQVSGASHFMVVLTKKNNLMRYDSEFIQHMMKDIQELPEDVIIGKKSVFEKFQKEDFKLLNSKKSLTEWASKQTYIAMANMMTGAASIKIDSCPIEGFHKEKTNKLLAKELGVDLEKYEISYMLAFGYRVNEPRSKTRQSLENIVEWH